MLRRWSASSRRLASVAVSLLALAIAVSAARPSLGAASNGGAAALVATGAPDAILARAVQDFHSNLIASARLGESPPGYAHGVWISYALKLHGGHFDFRRGTWQAQIITGLLRDISRDRGWPAVVGYGISLVLPNSTTSPWSQTS